MSLPFKKISIIGLGLIGSSIAKTLKKKFDVFISAYDYNYFSLKKAKQEKVIDEIKKDFDDFVEELIIICSPPNTIPEYLARLITLNYNGAVTEVSSIKKGIKKFFEKEKKNVPFFFVSSHPMAGSEKTGYDAGRDDLFENAACIITPYEGIPNVKILGDIATFWILLGCNTPVILDAEQHDKVIGIISHFPHLVATILSKIAKCEVGNSSLIKAIVGPGFKDTTRIAQGSPELWKEIIFANRENMEILLTEMEKEIKIWKKILKSPLKIQSYLEEIAKFRKYIQQ